MEKGNNHLDNVTFWKPKEGEVLKGRYMGFVEIPCEDEATGIKKPELFCVIEDGEGSEAYYAVPRWYSTNEALAKNIEKLVEGESILEVVMKGFKDMKRGKMAIVSMSLNGVIITGKEVLSGKDVAERLLRP